MRRFLTKRCLWRVTGSAGGDGKAGGIEGTHGLADSDDGRLETLAQKQVIDRGAKKKPHTSILSSRT
jgi:hypothetical protein